MHANKNGIALTRAELRALREFASKEETDRNRFGVQFEVRGDRCYARASDSRRCVEFEGESDGELGDNEWFVDMKFLIDGRKELEGKQVLRLCFSGASLHEAAIEENGVARLTMQRDEEAAISQVSFPQVSKALKVPAARRDKAHCVALAAGHMRAVQLAADAIEEEMVDFFVPSDADGLVIFRIGDDKQTSAIGGIKPNLSAESIVKPGEPDDQDDEDGDEETPKRGRKRNPKQQELPAGANGADVSAE